MELRHFPKSNWSSVDLWFSDLVEHLRSLKTEPAIQLLQSILRAPDLIHRIGPGPSHKIIRYRIADLIRAVSAQALH